ncbi:hypothetical protein ACI8AA_01430 [Geodermatophilus sp. SYSU D01180]
MPPSTDSGGLSRLRIVVQRSRTGCRQCDLLLLRCPRGTACPGSSAPDPVICLDCSWGLRCPTHGRHWTTA